MPKQSWHGVGTNARKRGDRGTRKNAESEGSWKRPNCLNFSLKQLTETHKYFVTLTNKLIKEHKTTE